MGGVVMKINITRKDWLFLIACIGLGILAEVSFLHGRVGLSYLVFISGFYLVVLLRFRLSFNHRRIGLLFMVVIWILSGSYLFYDNQLFHNLNLLLIPILIFSHIVLITSPNTFKWDTPRFINLLITKLREGRQYVAAFANASLNGLFKHENRKTAQTVKRILCGLAIGLPLLILITSLLMSADTIFQDVILRLPIYLFPANFLEGLLRFLFIMFVSFSLFGVFQVLKRRQISHDKYNKQARKVMHWNSITAMTILVMMNVVYLLFVVIQFRYFFNNDLMEGFTYASYARRGFFELILVMIINWTILISFLKYVTDRRRGIKLTLNILYSSLIIMSGIMLASGYGRLTMYEEAYGFTLDRVLAHAFMIYLMVTFSYTFIRVWIEKISLLHFYLIVGLIFYTMLNAINIEQLIVDKNLERYEQTGKIDVYYLDSLSYPGWDGLIQLYEMEEDYPALQPILKERQEWQAGQPSEKWQSFNFAKQKIAKELEELDLR